MKNIEYIDGNTTISTKITRHTLADISVTRPVFLSLPVSQEFERGTHLTTSTRSKTRHVNIRDAERLFITLNNGVSTIKPQRGRTKISLSAARIPLFWLERDLFSRQEAKDDPLKEYFNNMCFNYLNGRPALPKRGAPQILRSYFAEAQEIHAKSTVKALKAVRKTIIMAP